MTDLPPLTLLAPDAEAMMTRNPVTIRSTALVAEAARLMADEGIGTLAVVDEHERPVGVLSISDVAAQLAGPPRDPDASTDEWPAVGAGGRVADLMTPAVFSVTLQTPSREVVLRMLELDVHTLFVVDQTDQPGALVGAISSLDVLRQLRGSRA